MSCHDELTLSIYVDGELPPGEAVLLRSHLASCASCRAAVETLETEAAALRRSLQEVEDGATSATQEPFLGHGWSFCGIAAALVGLATTLDWLAAPPLPIVLTWVNPFDSVSVLGLLVRAGLFVLREGVPTMSPTIAAVLVLPFAAFHLRRGAAKVAGIATLIALACGSSARATEMRFPEKGRQIVEIRATETIDDTLFVGGDTVVVDGTVRGDMIAFAREVRVRGTVTGSIMCVAKRLEIDGSLDGDVYSMNESLVVRGRVGRSVHAMTERTEVEAAGTIVRDLLLMTGEARLRGGIGRNARVTGKLVELAGKVGGNAKAHAERVLVPESAEVGGDLTADVPKPESVEIAPAAQIHGARHISESATQTRVHGPLHALRDFARPRFYLWQSLWLAAALLCGGLFFWFAPFAFESQPQTFVAALKAAGVGFVSFVVTPFAVLVGALTVIGLPISLIVLSAWVAALYLTGIFTAAWLGRLILRRGTTDLRGFLLALLVGQLILRVVLHLPFLGGVACFITVVMGFGLLTAALRSVHARLRAA